jgi:5-methylcytosine-specific restriction enzyme A
LPFASKKPCRGCGAAISGRFCESCRDRGAAKETRPTAHRRGYGSRWQKTSAGFRAAHPLCADPYQVHGEIAVESEETDHIIPHRGDMDLFWDPENWQALCGNCHSRKTALEDGGFGRYAPGVPETMVPARRGG